MNLFHLHQHSMQCISMVHGLIAAPGIVVAGPTMPECCLKQFETASLQKSAAAVKCLPILQSAWPDG